MHQIANLVNKGSSPFLAFRVYGWVVQSACFENKFIFFVKGSNPFEPFFKMIRWIKNYKPTSNGLRYSRVFKKKAFSNFFVCKLLKTKLLEHSGRNNSGKVTIRFRKGRKHKKNFDVIDSLRNFKSGNVVSLKFNPVTKINIALMSNKKGFFKVKAPANLEVGSSLMSSSTHKNFRTLGNAGFLHSFPIGSIISNISIGNKVCYVRSGGSSGRLVAKIPKKAIVVELPSKKKKILPWNARAVLGSVSNSLKKFIVLGKAGKTAYQGRKPRVQGVSMNPIDHPHGGGTGKSTPGRNPVTPWGYLISKKTVRK